MRKTLAPLMFFLYSFLGFGCADDKAEPTGADAVSSVLSRGGGNAGNVSNTNREELQSIAAGKIAQSLGIMAYEVEAGVDEDPVVIKLLDGDQKLLGRVEYALAGDNEFDMQATLDVAGQKVAKLTLTHLDISPGVIVHSFALESDGTTLEKWIQMNVVDIEWIRIAVPKDSVSEPPSSGTEFKAPTGEYYILDSLAPDGTEASDEKLEQWLNETGRAALLTSNSALGLFVAVSDTTWATAITGDNDGSVSGGLSVKRGGLHLSDECGSDLTKLNLAVVAAGIACTAGLAIPFVGVVVSAATCSTYAHLQALAVVVDLNCDKSRKNATTNCDGHCEAYEKGALPESRHGPCDCNCEAEACSAWCNNDTSPPEGQQVCSTGHACTLESCTCNIAVCGDGTRSTGSGCEEECESNEDCASKAEGDQTWVCTDCKCVLQPTTESPEPK